MDYSSSMERWFFHFCDYQWKLCSESVNVHTRFFQINIVRHDIDFVKVNGCAAKRFQIKKSPSMTALDDVKKQVDTDEKMHRKGEVPK